MKISIIGASGSGKTYVSRILENKYSLYHCDLDEIFWDNTGSTYNVKARAEERNKKLLKILQHENWVIEGVYYEWLEEVFKKADYIFIIKSYGIIWRYRLFKRHLMRRLTHKEGKNETFKSFIKLIRWNKFYYSKKLPIILNFLEPYKSKIVVVKNASQLIKYLDKVKLY